MSQLEPSKGRLKPLLSPRALFLFLLSCILFLMIADIVRLILGHGFGHHTVMGLARLFDLDGEGNVPAWFSTVQLSLASIVCGAVYLSQRSEGLPFARHWAVLGILLLLMSLEESVAVHDHLNLLANRKLGTHIVFGTPWVIPAALFCLIAWWSFRGFLKALPERTRRLIFLSGAVFVLGAVGVESVYGILISGLFGYPPHHGNLLFGFMTLVEEFMEMVGIALFIYAVVDYASQHCSHLAPLLNGGSCRPEPKA